MGTRHGVQAEVHHTAVAATAGTLVVAAENIAPGAVLRIAAVLEEDHMVLEVVVDPIVAEGDTDQAAGRRTVAG